jgi:iron complex outermembrane receptor protein
MKLHHPCALLASACVAALGCALPARAQSPGGGSALSEVIVTARKRQESILNVPVVETALPRQTLERLQVNGVEDLPKLAPGLGVGRAVLEVGAQVSLRGIGTSSLDPGLDQSVSLIVDGVQLGSGLAFTSSTFDLQQVEVMKGPQSLFYGKSSPAGVISMRTADPTDRLELIARAGFEAESVERRGELIISGPLSDTLKLRLAGMWSEADGYFHNVAVPLTAFGAKAPRYDRAPHSNRYQLRGTALWNPTDAFSARLKLNVVRDKIYNPELSQLVSCPMGLGATAGIPFIGGGEDCRLDRNIRIVSLDTAAFPQLPFGGHPATDTYQTYGGLELNYKFASGLTLTSTTGYYLNRSQSMFNTFETTYAPPVLGFVKNYRRRDVTEEVRLNSDYSGPFNFTAGLFYQDGSMSNRAVGVGDRALPPPLGAIFAAADSDNYVDIGIRTYSVFGQLRWKITPGLELAAGARWTDEKRTEALYSFNRGRVGAGIPAVPAIRSKRAAPEVTLTYKPGPDVTVFAAYKRGYKSGSFSIATPKVLVAPLVTADNSFGDEQVEGGEIGLKSYLMDHRVSFNIAGYRYDYKGLQVGAVGTPDCPTCVPPQKVINAAGARTYGVDMQFAFRPEQVEGLQLNAALNWNHARYRDFRNAQCWAGQTISQGCNQEFVNGVAQAQDLSGTPLIRAPAWQGNFGFDYEWSISETFQATLTSNTAYQSRYATFLAVGRPNADNFQNGYVTTDLGLTLARNDGAWEVAIIGKNLTDKITTSNCAAGDYNAGVALSRLTTGTATSAGAGALNCFSDPGREVWLRLTVRPFAAR